MDMNMRIFYLSDSKKGEYRGNKKIDINQAGIAISKGSNNYKIVDNE